MRLDRLLCQHPQWSRRHAQTLLVQGKVCVDETVIRDGTFEVSAFAHVKVDGTIVQKWQKALYLMLHKPEGILSATADPEHQTVMDLLPLDLASLLHIGGRLDRASSGLILLTNDGLWSRRVTEPSLKKPKVYRVTTGNPIHPDTAKVFSEGIYFPYEDVITSPAQLEQLGTHTARLTIYEGRYHQIKRMFGRFRNPVTGLHREIMGDIKLDDTLAAGEYRFLTEKEVQSV